MGVETGYEPNGETSELTKQDQTNPEIAEAVSINEGLSAEEVRGLVNKITDSLLSTGYEGDVIGKNLFELVDINEQHNKELYRKYAYDSLTDLLRPEPFSKKLNATLERNKKVEVGRVERERKQGALLFIDLNGMAALNARLGHLGTNDVLKRFAEKLKALRQGDLVMRLGGDEFIMYMHEADPDQIGYSVIRRILDSEGKLFIEAMDKNGEVKKVDVTFSVGVAPVTTANVDPEVEARDLMNRANIQEQIAKAESDHSKTVLSYITSDGGNIIKYAEEIIKNGEEPHTK